MGLRVRRFSTELPVYQPSSERRPQGLGQDEERLRRVLRTIELV